MKVVIKEHTPNVDKLIAASARQCYSEGFSGIINDLKENEIKPLIEKIINMGHTSVLEHASFTFAIEGISRACYDEKTEVYTEEGWKLFKDLNKSEKIITRNENGLCEFNLPEEYICYNYKGLLHKYESQNVNLLITPNHNLFMKKYDITIPTEYKLTSSEDIKINRFYMTKKLNFKDKNIKTVCIKGDNYFRKNKNGIFFEKNIEDLTIDSVLFVKFLAWYLSEGSCYYNSKENSYTISISQTDIFANIKSREEIINIIKELGFSPQVNSTTIYFKNRQLGQFVKQLGLSYEKYIPEEIFNIFDKNLAQHFLNSYKQADASIDKKGHIKLYTTSKKLADQLQMIIFISGNSANIWKDDRVGQKHLIKGKEVKHNHICYIISLSESGRNIECVVKKDKHFSEEFYDGKVYCVNIPNHVILVRRNGIVIWCGNCTHQLVRFRHASFSQQSQRYVEFKNGFEHITPPSIENDSDCLECFKDFMIECQQHYEYFISKGIPAEDARFILPNATETKIVMTMNCRELHHAFNLRCCNHAQWEIRNLFNEILKQVKEIAPATFAKAGASCEAKGICSEGSRSCGKIKLFA